MAAADKHETYVAVFGQFTMEMACSMIGKTLNLLFLKQSPSKTKD
jgi:hypothetical protein